MLQTIEAEALKNLSNYAGEGGEDGYDGDDYDGFSDALVDFDDFNGLSKSFATEVRMNRVYLLRVINTNATAEKFVMAATFFNLWVPAGQLMEGSFSAISGATLSAAGQPSNVDALRIHFMLNPTRILGFKLQSANLDNHESMIEVQTHSPFQKLPTRYIYIGNYRDENDFKDNITSVKEGFNFDNQTTATFTIAPNSTMNFTFVFGAVLNTAKALRRKRVKAKRVAIQKGRQVNGFAGDE
ncbi:hypothetical protein [Flavobacterium filum]|uniref:hypothetical protein n=1 Tax=Flavobacterium filum TaxID=370974 RepID=UPI0023F21C24|nr:hypothetical protein [Flavobacterium filum]